MKARLCVGNYATNAYCFESLGLMVYCMEELAYCLKQHAFLLGTEIMSDELLHFIGSDCQVPDLARELYPMVHQKGTLSDFVTSILDYVGFFEEAEVREIEDAVRLGSGLTDYEKKKRQADHLMEKKKYHAAIEAYDKLIEEMGEEAERDTKKASFVADLYFNRGVVYAHMFLYKHAAASFRISYDWKKDPETIKNYFLARRMELPQQEYVALMAKHPECYEISMQIEKNMQEVGEKWDASESGMGLENMRSWRMTGDNHKYYSECDQMINTIQEEYRNYI